MFSPIVRQSLFQRLFKPQALAKPLDPALVDHNHMLITKSNLVVMHIKHNEPRNLSADMAMYSLSACTSSISLATVKEGPIPPLITRCSQK
jgi:hypothetical protein